MPKIDAPLIATTRIIPIHPALATFNDLPDAAFVPITVVCQLFSCSPATVWRRVKSGDLSAPQRFGARTTRWNVGQLRQSLRVEVA